MELLLKGLERREEMGRVINPKGYLQNLIKEGETYHVGFGVKELTTLGIHYPEISELIKGNISELIISGKKGPLKENTNGKFVRKQPEEKTEELKRIRYTNKSGRKVDFERLYVMWKKELLHNFNLKLYKSKSPQGEIILHFSLFVMENIESHYLKVKSAMNISNLLGGYFQLFNSNFEPIVKKTGTLNRKILEKGIGNVRDKLEDMKETLAKGLFTSDNSGNSYRFAILQDFNITDVFDGLGGFNEYYHFEFANDDILILENLRNGHATYVFKLSRFDKDFVLDKQIAKGHPSFLERIVHQNIKEWDRKIGKYITKKPIT